MTGGILGQAVFSPGDPPAYRRWLSRAWREGNPALVCMCNPSKAGAEESDPTIERCNELFRLLGYPGYTVVNWSPYISTDPKHLRRWLWNSPAEVAASQAENLEIIREKSAGAAVRVVAWGNLVESAAPYTGRVLAALSLDGLHPLYCFATTKSGAPRHPMARGRERLIDGAPLYEWKAKI